MQVLTGCSLAAAIWPAGSGAAHPLSPTYRPKNRPNSSGRASLSLATLGRVGWESSRSSETALGHFDQAFSVRKTGRLARRGAHHSQTAAHEGR